MATVLIANKDASERTLLRQYVECCGHAVVEAVTGRDAAHNLQTYVVDLAIIDLFLPEADGLFLIKGLRDRGKRLKVIAMSDYKHGEQLHLAKLLGADAILRKPVHTAELNRVFNRYVPAASHRFKLKMQSSATH